MKTILNFIVLLILILVLKSCDLSNSPITESASVIEITSPVSNSQIPQGYIQINYQVAETSGLLFIELYANGEFAGNFPPGTDGSLPVIEYYIDTSFVNLKINLYLVYYGTDGSSAKSNTIENLTIIENQDPPFAPYDIHLEILSESVVNVFWKDSSLNTKKYEIWRRTNFTGDFGKINEISAPAFNINDEGLSDDSIYEYKINAVNDFGVSPFSEEVNTLGGGTSGSLFPPTGLNATALGSQYVILNWIDNSSEENFFRVERKTSFDSFTVVGAVNKDVTAFKDTLNGLQAGTVYYYRVKAFSSTDSAWSNIASTQTYWYDIPVPVNLIAKFTGSAVLLTWQDNDPVNTLFEIEKNSNDGGFNLIASVSGDSSRFTDVEISSGLLSYRLRSTDGRYYSDYSNIAEILIP
ncbi:MAG: hypothetical protein Kow0098_22830 [Ignavibacteriaceae bacterium]